MKIIIAEKPDQGATLASIFRTKKRQGYIEILPNDLFPDGAYMTWAIGHLFQLAPPERYRPEWKRWSLKALPIIPERFEYEVEKAKAKQFRIVKELLRKPEVTEIIHAGDAGREGELIVRNVIRLSGVHKPIKRLWLSSLTPKAIEEGFRRLLDERTTRPLYEEAYARACADWLVGMNASRAYSLLLKERGMNDVFSVGRVQTPTLALIVRREREIEQFRPEPFWEVVASFVIGDKRYEGKWTDENGQTRLKDEAMAKQIAAFCRGKRAEVAAVRTERKTFQPPPLFNLSTLQATANKLYRFSPKKTLDVLQSLYQKGIVSYPRSDSMHVTRGEAETFPAILQKLSSFPAYASYFPVPHPSILHNKRYVNEKKVTDHYAIIPTEQVIDPEKLSSDERNVYDLVVRRLIAAHYQAAIIDYTTVATLVDGRARFITKGRQVIEEGWRAVIRPHEEEKETVLPLLRQGEAGKVADVQVKEGKTEPPKRYTEGQLITLMKTAGKFLDDEALEKVLAKTEGLGTEATRAAIITMLKERKYIEVKNNLVYATDKAKVLIEALGGTILASPEMTAKWEQRLSEIGEGTASSAAFMEQVKKLAQKVVTDAIAAAPSWNFSGLDTASIQRTKTKKTVGEPLGRCPLCGGTVIDKGTLYGCDQYAKTKCSFTISKRILGQSISAANVKKLLAQGKTNVIKGFKKGGKTFDAVLVWDENDKKLSFQFPKR
ncbi:DNA topoisomerase III [Geobacillus subterraneus]|uniref:DNA topoisomerase n=2 Tax=Geobacillus TaxID=129337 RepID=A0ABN4NFW7_9BACL|nr:MULTISPECIES: DNA topoisomerase III [Geobacillus]AMX83523.1 DNA topoisomerase III [Geobacillus subterraneus]KZS25051.1 DNA topoisomerase III [Geobacillus subterraneus]OXB87755.1 DNA topoisomerase III [Geobacillus uzenensis]QIZ67853.1 DNA topoisomerase III [Geobacillus subterraneus]WPZ16852.1 DNA topoisomerase III [Geobacillus subterraneus]